MAQRYVRERRVLGSVSIRGWFHRYGTLGRRHRVHHQNGERSHGDALNNIQWKNCIYRVVYIIILFHINSLRALVITITRMVYKLSFFLLSTRVLLLQLLLFKLRELLLPVWTILIIFFTFGRWKKKRCVQECSSPSAALRNSSRRTRQNHLFYRSNTWWSSGRRDNLWMTRSSCDNTRDTLSPLSRIALSFQLNR